MCSRAPTAVAARRPAVPGTARTSAHLPVSASESSMYPELEIASHVFLGPIPIIEYTSNDPRLFTLATALLESGTGSGSNFGWSAANKNPPRRIRRISPKHFFIAEDFRTGGALVDSA